MNQELTILAGSGSVQALAVLDLGDEHDTLNLESAKGGCQPGGEAFPLTVSRAKPPQQHKWQNTFLH